MAPRKKKTSVKVSKPQREDATKNEASSTKSRRRSFLAGVGGFVGGVVTGVAGGYLTDYAKAVNPPGEQADRNSTEDPIRAIILRERDIGSQGELWVFPYRLSSRDDVAQAVLNGFDNDDDRVRFYFRNGAIDPNVSSMKLIVEGRRNSGVRIVDIRAKIHKMAEPLANCTVLTPGPQGESPSAMIGFDLDGAETSALRTSKDEFADVFTKEYFGKPYFAVDTVGLNRTEQQVFQIMARTVRHYVEWYVEVVLLVDNVEKSYQYGINDRPIITTALYPQDGLSDMRNVLVPQEDRYAEVYLDSRFTDEGQSDGATSATFVRTK